VSKEAVPSKEPSKEAVPSKEPSKEVVPSKEPSNEAVRSREPSKEAVRSREPSKEAAPSREASKEAKEAVPSKEPSKEAVPSREPSKEAAPSKEPSKEAAPSKEPSKEAVPQREPSKEAVPSKEPSKEAVPDVPAAPETVEVVVAETLAEVLAQDSEEIERHMAAEALEEPKPSFLSKKVSDWTKGELTAWLISVNLRECATMFEKEEIAGDVLFSFDKSDLKKMGLSLGDIKRLQKRIAKRKAEEEEIEKLPSVVEPPQADMVGA